MGQGKCVSEWCSSLGNPSLWDYRGMTIDSNNQSLYVFSGHTGICDSIKAEALALLVELRES